MQWLDAHNYAEGWFGEHYPESYKILFIATAAERTRYIRLGTGVNLAPAARPPFREKNREVAKWRARCISSPGDAPRGGN